MSTAEGDQLLAGRRGAAEVVEGKLSDELRHRLARLDPDRLVRAIVLLRTGVPAGPGRRRDREAVIRAVRAAAASAMSELEPQLEAFGGRWLAELPDALGSVPVEITPGGLVELALSEHVRAILEDQPVAALPRPAHIKRTVKPR